MLPCDRGLHATAIVQEWTVQVLELFIKKAHDVIHYGDAPQVQLILKNIKYD